MDLFHLIFAVFLEFFEFKIFAKWQNLQKTMPKLSETWHTHHGWVARLGFRTSHEFQLSRSSTEDPSSGTSPSSPKG